ncbi:MAG: PDZ domain-containing protein [Planctomycetota bacterium]
MEAWRVTTFGRVAAIALGMLVSGCAGTGTKPLLERGWIGGEFRTVSTWSWPFADDLAVPSERLGQKGAVLVTEVFEGTPTHVAGLVPGDVLLACDGDPVVDVGDLHEVLDEARPGSTVTLKLLRAGKLEDVPVVIGREQFRRYGLLHLGLGLSTHLDLIPNPDFDVLGLIWYRSHTDRLELRSPEARLITWAGSGSRLTPREGCQFWLLVFGLGRQIEVVSQEVVAARADAGEGPSRPDAS